MNDSFMCKKIDDKKDKARIFSRMAIMKIGHKINTPITIKINIMFTRDSYIYIDASSNSMVIKACNKH